MENQICVKLSNSLNPRLPLTQLRLQRPGDWGGRGGEPIGRGGRDDRIIFATTKFPGKVTDTQIIEMVHIGEMEVMGLV